MNKIGGNINHIKNVVNGFIPSVKKESFIFNWSEINSVIDSINSAWNKFKVVQLTEFFFTVFLWNFNKLTDSGQSEPSIIFGDDSQVVLDQHSMKIISMSCGVFKWITEKFKSIGVIDVDITCYNFLKKKIIDQSKELWVTFKRFIGLKFFKFFLVLWRPSLKSEESDIIGEDMGKIWWESEIEFIRNDLFCRSQCVVNDFIASGSFLVIRHMVVIDGKIWVISDFNVSDFIIVNVLFVDFFTDDKKSDVILLFQHDFHLI